MPGFSWKEEDMSHSLAFFPLVGILIGALVLLVNIPGALIGLPLAVRLLLTVAVPLSVTGGIHLDGFMDTEDALRSYGEKERKLEILKDPHIGAFAVIGLVKILLFYGAAVLLILLDGSDNPETLWLFASLFVTARCLSGLTALLFPKAKKEGMLHEETKGYPKSVLVFLALELTAVSAYTLYLDPLKGGVLLLVFACCGVWYGFLSRREFGGVTGDTAGHFLVLAETVSAMALAACTLIFP